MQMPIHEIYGSTEIAVVTRDGVITKEVLEWRLEDVPELGYLTTDRPFPRGELLVRTITTVSGYYKQEKVRS